MALLLDELLSSPAPGRKLGRGERAKLTQLLLDLLAAVLEEDADDDVLEALHDKYSDVSREEIRQAEVDMAHTMLQDVFGLDIDDDHNASSPEELLEHAHRKMQDRAQHEERLAQEREDARAAKRSKSSAAKAEAAQAKREQAAKEVSQSLREVYRKLASALHPDRETDPDARQRKTSMMQRVNQAYDANDLLTLLGLQLEIEQIDVAHLASVPPQRLAHYNQILKEQLSELEAELAHCVLPFLHSMGMGWGASLSPATVDQALSADIAELRAAKRQIEQDLVAFRDPRKLREALKHYELEPDFDEVDDLPELMDVLQAFAPVVGGKKRRRG
jgi:hypothetical protein